MKDKGAAAGGAPVKASAKRSARHKADGAVERGERAERAERADRSVAAAAPQSAMQAFRTAVKKAANKMKGRKPRR
jgi:ribonuclease R